MYKSSDKSQSSFLDFNQPMGLHMNQDNRWIKMADCVPWEVFEKKYKRLFKVRTGNAAKPLRTALGALIIQIKFQYSDRELVERFKERTGHYPERVLADQIYRTRCIVLSVWNF